MARTDWTGRQEGGGRPHPDELRLVEEHLQTQHKLDTMRIYWGKWSSIILSARQSSFDASEVFLIDAFAGAGMHASKEHPDGRRFGTALLACQEARKVQRRFPKAQVRVRLVDKENDYCDRLTVRVREFTEASEGPEKVDVQVLHGTFAGTVERLLGETDPSGRQLRSLWLLDPYSVDGIPHDAVAKLAVPAYGPEVVINLDLGAVWRLTKAGHGGTSGVEAIHRAALDDLYGVDGWKAGIQRYKGESNVLAQVYADTFPRFHYRRAHQLSQTANQMRYFVHLSHARRAVSAFADAVAQPLKGALFSSARQLSESDRARAASRLHELFRGQTVTVTDMYEADTGLDRGQLQVVCEWASDGGYGRWERPSQTMDWSTERSDPQQSLGL